MKNEAFSDNRGWVLSDQSKGSKDEGQNHQLSSASIDAAIWGEQGGRNSADAESEQGQHSADVQSVSWAGSGRICPEQIWIPQVAFELGTGRRNPESIQRNRWETGYSSWNQRRKKMPRSRHPKAAGWYATEQHGINQRHWNARRIYSSFPYRHIRLKWIP